MTQDEYKLFTGETVSYAEDDWDILVGVASSRLASFLCLETLPTPLPEDLAWLLAQFLCAMLKFQGNGSAEISSKTVRNFSISFKDSDVADLFAQVARNSADLIDKYSACSGTFAVEVTPPGAYVWAGWP